MDKPKFFFDDEPDPQTVADNEEFFSTLVNQGTVVQAKIDLSEKQIDVQASMKKIGSQLVTVEFGVYQENYAIHITPIHPQRNIVNDPMLKKALRRVVVVLNEFVPYTLSVQLHLPREDWKMKVVSVVIAGGATAWNLDTDKLEVDCMPRILQAVEDVIMGKP